MCARLSPMIELEQNRQKVSNHFVQKGRSYKRILFRAGWFEMGLLGRNERSVTTAFQVKKAKEYCQSMPK